MQARFEKDHFAFERGCSHFNSSLAINAVPICNSSAFQAGAHKTLHLQVLFERLEKQLDFPAVLVDGGDGGGSEVQQIAQQNDFSFVDLVPNHYAPQQMRAVGSRLRASEPDGFIS